MLYLLYTWKEYVLGCLGFTIAHDMLVIESLQAR